MNLWPKMLVFTSYLHLYDTNLKNKVNFKGLKGGWCSIYWDFPIEPPLGFKRIFPKRKREKKYSVLWEKMSFWCQRRMIRLLETVRKAIVAKITTKVCRRALWMHSMANLEEDGLQQQQKTKLGSTPIRKNRKLRLQFTRVHENWTKDDSLGQI